MDSKDSSPSAAQRGYGFGKRMIHSSSLEEVLQNLEKTKSRVFRTFEETAPIKFKTFFKSNKYDKFLETLAMYFVCFFKHVSLERKREPGDEDIIKDLQRETNSYFSELASIYAQIILTQSEHAHIQQDKLFWETFYDSTDQIVQELFIGYKKTKDIEIELGRIFRTEYFNMAERRSELKRDPTNYSVRELYALKNEGDPVINSRILARLYSKSKSNSVQMAALKCSPLIEYSMKR